MKKPRVVIGHEHRLFSAGLEHLLAPEFDVVGSVHTLQSLPAAVIRLHPDVVIQGLSSPHAVGLGVISRIHTVTPDTAIVVVTQFEDVAIATEAFRRGASAYIPLTSPPSELLVGIRAAISDAPYLPASLAATAMASLLDASEQVPLTPRQREVVRLLAEGKSMKDVAAALQVTTRTVAFHKYTIMRLLNIKSSAELVRFALKHGIV